MRKLTLAAALAAATISTAAFASVTFDPATGLGWVGKGDVQLAFGWNNQAAQANAKAVSFSYNATDTYDVGCEWSTGTNHVVVHDITVPKHTSVSSSVLSDPRKTGQWTGYNLNGLGATVTDGSVPVVGATCPGNSGLGLVTDVTLTGSTGGLYVNYGGTSVLLPPTPTV